jgi:hypothetical protein
MERPPGAPDRHVRVTQRPAAPVQSGEIRGYEDSDGAVRGAAPSRGYQVFARYTSVGHNSTRLRPWHHRVDAPTLEGSRAASGPRSPRKHDDHSELVRNSTSPRGARRHFLGELSREESEPTRGHAADGERAHPQGPLARPRRSRGWVSLAVLGLVVVLMRLRKHEEVPQVFDEQDRHLDGQTLEFTKLRQQLVYYVAGLATALLAFVGVLARDNKTISGDGVALAVVGVAGLVAVAATVQALRNQHRSFQRNLRYASQGRKWENLSPREKHAWDSVNRASTRWFNAALAAVVIEFAAVGYVVWLLAR